VNWLDIVLIAALALSVVGGAAAGFAKVGIGFAAAVAGFFCGLWFYGAAGSFFLPYVSHKGIAGFLGFALIFLAFVIGGALIGKLLGTLFKWTGLSWLDRILGAAFGVVRGLVIAVAIVVALMAFAPTKPPRSVVESRFAPYVVGVAQICASLAPREVKDGVYESYERIKKMWSEALDKGLQKPDEKTF
jgi:membrane protein required for colicin V production